MSDHQCCLRGLVCCLRHGQPPTPPQQGARDDWRRTPDRPDTHHAGKQTLLRAAEREEKPLATTTKRTTTGKCTGTDVVQHLNQRPAHTRRHSQLHLRRRRVHRVARKRLHQHRSVTHVCPERYDYLVRHEPTACEPFKDTCVCSPPKEPKSQTRTECSVERYQKATTLRPSCLALCYSAAEYACPMWARSTHAHKLNPALHECCRIISGCLKPTNLDSVHILADIAPPHTRRTVACRMERTRQTTDARHQLFHHQPAASRLKSRKSVMLTVPPFDSSASSSRLRLWNDSLTDVPASVKWEWRWPSLCRLDLERTGSVASP